MNLRIVKANSLGVDQISLAQNNIAIQLSIVLQALKNIYKSETRERTRKMPRVNAKRQVTLPISICDELGIKKGDEIEIYRYKEQINLIKKEAGSAAGMLKGLDINDSVSDEGSLYGRFE